MCGETGPTIVAALHCPIGAPMREKLLSAYADAAKDVPCANRTLSFESVMHHLLSNSSYMPKGHDIQLRKKVLPTLTGCINTLSATLHAENVQQTATTTVGQDTHSSLNSSLPGGKQVSTNSLM